MKKTTTVLVMCLVYTIVFSQDLIYTISGELNAQKTALDSILVENLTNNSRVLFNNLPVEKDYQINLSKKSYWGTTNSEQIEDSRTFKVVMNIPGKLTIQCNVAKPVDTRLFLFSLNGQQVFNSIVKTVEPGQTIDFEVGATGIYLAKIQTSDLSRSFKVVGANNYTGYNIVLSESFSIQMTTKSTGIASEDFSFSVGDSIRISAYKEGYYAFPVGLTIVSSEFVNFQFKQSMFESTGISDAYVPLDENLTDVVYYNQQTGDATINYTGDKPLLAVGAIVTLDLDTMGYLREIIKVEESEGSISVKTVPAAMNDVFIDYELLLNTKMIEPKSVLKSTSSLQEISEALTDEQGYIHPVEIYYENSDGEIKLKSALEATSNEPIIKLEKDLSRNLYNQGAANLSISDGSASFIADAVYEFNFEKKDEISIFKKLIKGELKTFKFYLLGESQFMLELSLNLSAGIEIGNKEPVELFEIKRKWAKFQAGYVPVWISFDGGLYTDFTINAEASIEEKWGFQISDSIKIGGIYKNEGNNFTPVFKDYPPVKKVLPFETTGELNLSTRLDLYPKVESKLYGVLGPYFELVPYAKANLDAKLKTVNSAEEKKEFMAWNSGIDLGLDFRTGAKLDAFSQLEGEECGPVEYNFFEESIWNTPDTLEMLTVLPEIADSGEVINLEFKVLDNLGNDVPGCPVYIEGDGTFNDEVIPSTDENGEVVIDWTLSESGELKFVASIYNAEGSVIKDVKGSVIVNDGQNDICATDWYSEYFQRSIAVTNAGIAYALDQTPAKCNAYKQAIQEVLDFLALYKDCDRDPEDEAGYQSTVNDLTNTLNGLDCN